MKSRKTDTPRADAADIQTVFQRNVGAVQPPVFEVEAVRERGADIRLCYVDGVTRLGDTLSGPVLMTVADAAM